MRPLWVLSIVLRLVLFYLAGAVPATLLSRIEISTPLSSFKVLSEGLFLLRHNQPLYDGGSFVQAPLTLFIFRIIPPILVPLFFIGVDLVIATCLTKIAVYKHNRDLSTGLIPEVAVIDKQSQHQRQKSQINSRQQQLSNSSSVQSNLDVLAKPTLESIPMTKSLSTNSTLNLASNKEKSFDASNQLSDSNSTSNSSSNIPKSTGITPSSSIDGLYKRLYKSHSALSLSTAASQPASISNSTSNSSLFQSGSVFNIADEFYPTEVLGDRYIPVYLKFEPSDLAAIYLLCPFSILACIGCSMASVENMFVIVGLTLAIHKHLVLSLASILFAVHMSIYPVVFILPALALYKPRYKGKDIKRALSLCIGIFGLYNVLSYLIVGNWSYISGCYFNIFLIRDLTPNIGIYWYFMVEVFDQFRSFFLFVFQISSFMFLIPYGVVYRKHPLFGVLALQIILTVFKSYPSIADISFYLALIPLYREIFSYMSQVFVIFSIYIFVTFLEPLFFYLWIYAGGNANFFYAITLVLLLGECILLLDLGSALRRRLWDIDNPALRRARVEVVRI